MAPGTKLAVVKLPPDDRSRPRATPALSSVEWSDRVARHRHKVTLCLLAMGLPYDRAIELNQEVWMRLFEQHGGGALERLELPGLALAQARYLGLAELRRVRSGPVTSLEALPEIAVLPRAEAQLCERQSVARVLAALERESSINRRVFELVYRDPGRPQAEVAIEVGLSLQRVRQILTEVRRRLRLALEQP
jgi:DNA-directed RNA polymerase specialized sigma24 family protein